MEIQKINNSPNFQAIKLTSKEGRKISEIVREYRKSPNPKLQEQLVDIFTPHIEKEAEKYDGILREDFKQDLYMSLLENMGKVDVKYQPSNNLVGKLNEVAPADSKVSMGLQYLEEVSKAELDKLSGPGEDEFIRDLNLKTIMLDLKNIINRSDNTPRMRDIITAKIEGKSDKEIGEIFRLTKGRVQQIIQKILNRANIDPEVRARIGTDQRLFRYREYTIKELDTVSEYYERMVAKKAAEQAANIEDDLLILPKAKKSKHK